MSDSNELACVYSALILLDDDIAITAEKISTILKAAKVDVEPYWPGLFAKALDGLDIRAMITNVGVGGGGAAAPAGPAAGGGAAAAPAPAAESKKEEKKEEKKKEEEPESDEDMGFGLFD